jgi:Porin subfamily
MAGFTIPATGACFKISGYLSAQVESGNVMPGYSWGFMPGHASVAPGTSTNLGPWTSGTSPGAALNARNSLGWTTRTSLVIDARQDTEFGVLRSYAELRFENGNGFDNTHAGSFVNIAYVQWAGITAGKASSFFPLFGGGEAWANIFSPDQQSSNVPDQLAYSAKFGNVLATIAAQSTGTNKSVSGPPGNQTIIGSGGGTNIEANTTTLGMEAPDVVAAFRLKESWGTLQLSGVAHPIHVQDSLGYAENKWGWGALAGMKFNLPALGPGDIIQVQGVWTRNAIRYSGIPDGIWGENGAVNGNGLPMVVADTWSNGDGSFATPTAWSIGGTFEHRFSPAFALDPEASYANLRWSGVIGNVIPAAANSWIVGGVAHWDPVPQLDFAVELLFQDTRQSRASGASLSPGVASFPADADGFAGRLYATRSF